MAQIDKFAGVHFDTLKDAITAFNLVAGRDPNDAEKQMLRSAVVPSASPIVLQRRAKAAFHGREEFHNPPRKPKPLPPKA